MPTDGPAFDVGLLSPVTVGHDRAVSDAAVLDALVTAEVALVRARGALGLGPDEVVHRVSDSFGWTAPGEPCRGHAIDASALAAASLAGGNPVIPLVKLLTDAVGADAEMHRGATSQDILDSALMFTASRAAREISASLHATAASLRDFASAHRSQVAAARTLTQHAVPTTVGLRAANWLRGVERAELRVDAAAGALPAQLAGAGGTLASFVELYGADAAAELPAAFAAELALAAPEAPWHTTRWPVTELADALVQAIDAVGVIATDVATLSRTEIAELSEGVGGGSSAMPQKQNPAASVLIRSAALRAPQLAATLHLASAFAVDERPDGAWHAEWPALRELLRLALGATATAARLVGGLQVDADAVARNLDATRGLIVAERLSLVLSPLIGKSRVAATVAAAGRGEDLAALLRAEPELADTDVDALLDPAGYTGAADALVDRAVSREQP
ncbi:lyase family protein [uncultured Microbacterium sp.]|uniref:lyase family protein n=1 Tax=uncultured Microbacterium sp. TaxID=191216 RepID=UPI0028D65007|nr:lyase family protein [uncultured Microbacterium sp.]